MSDYGNLTYGTASSESYGIYVADVNDADKPERDYSTYSIPGRSRDLHYDNGRYKNIDRIYKMVVYAHDGASAEEIVDEYIASLMRQSGYQRITDTIHSDYYKLGEFRGGTVPEFDQYKHCAYFELTFDCDARKYLTSGETAVTLSSSNTLVNAGTLPALPVITTTGTGTITIDGITLTVASHSGTMVIDCEMGDAYKQSDGSNLNSALSVSGDGTMPTLGVGSTSVTVSGSGTWTITPRWIKL